MSVKNTNINKTVISPNLLPFESKEEFYYQAINDTLQRVVMILSFFVILFWLVGGVLLWRIDSEKNNITLRFDNNVDSQKIQELKKINDQSKEIRILNSKVTKSAEKEYRFSMVLEELAKITPRGLVITNFETVLEQPGWIKIRGAAQNRDLFLRFKQDLEHSPLYSKVESPLSNYVSPESVNFELNAQLKDWEPSWAKDLKKKPVNQIDTDKEDTKQ